MKGTLIFGVVAALFLSVRSSGQAPSSTIHVSYDKFKDSTEVSTNESKIGNAIGHKNRKQDLSFNLSYLCPGNTSHCRPDTVELTFISYSEGEYANSHDLALTVDGKKIRAKPSWKGGYAEGGALIEQMETFLPVDVFWEMVRAERIDGKLGQTTFHLADDNVAAMRALASQMT